MSTNPKKSWPRWLLLSVAANGLLAPALIWLSVKPPEMASSSPVTVVSRDRQSSQASVPPAANTANTTMGPRHQLNYQQWLDLLDQEARAAASDRPPHLTVLLGDSLSLWFPTDLLPPDRSWLNQGISGETTVGLLRRLALLDQTRPDQIFLMIGINDLIRGVGDETIVANQREIIQYLKEKHPNTQLIVQSLLPHAGEESTWEGRDRLLALSNDRVRAINQRLQIVAREEQVYYLDLYPLFADSDGNLQSGLTTDGLHLSDRGYLVWRTALELYSRVELGGN